MNVPTLVPGQRVDYFGQRGDPPIPGTVISRLGSAWASLQLDDGCRIEVTFVAASHHQSPCGDYCMKATP